MKKRKFYTFQEHLRESLRSENFRKAWEKTEPEYILAREIIRKRIKKNMSQRELARKAKTTQAVICKIENMRENPSLLTLKRIAKALDSEIFISLN